MAAAANAADGMRKQEREELERDVISNSMSQPEASFIDSVEPRVPVESPSISRRSTVFTVEQTFIAQAEREYREESSGGEGSVYGNVRCAEEVEGEQKENGS